MRGFLTFVGLSVGWLMLAVAGVAIWLHYTASRGTVAIYATALVPSALVIGAVGLVLFLAMRRWIAVSLSVVAVAVLIYTQFPLWVSQTVPAGERFTVVSANLQLGRANVDDLAAIADDADLVSLQEVTPEELARIRASALVTRFRYEYAQPDPGAAGSMLLSRTELRDTQRVPNTNHLSALTSVPGAPQTRVLAVHPPAPRQGYSSEWAASLALLRDYLHALPEGPVIVAGDFNATWDHKQFRDLLGDGFSDATAQSGSGYQLTFPTDELGGVPLAGIDHVVVRGFQAAMVSTQDLPGSDHRALKVSLVAS